MSSFLLLLLLGENPRENLVAVKDQLAGLSETEARQTTRDAALATRPDGTTDEAGNFVDGERVAEW